MVKISAHPKLTAARLTAQLLAGPPASDPPAVAERLLAVQAQDQRGARLAVRARTEGLAASDVDRALTDRRSLVITWLNRGTLHLVRSEDYPWLQALTTPRQLTATARRLAHEGVAPGAADRGVAVMERSLADEGPLTRPQLGERIAAAGVRTEGQALIHILALACLRGLAVRGPMVGGSHAYALVRDWLDDPGPVDRGGALAELARRYLAGHGPAGERDLAKWAGLPLSEARAGLSAIASELDRRGDGLVDLAGRRAAEECAPPRLLGAFDPVLLGWTSREALLGRHRDAVLAGGMFRPFALVRGRVVATWSMPRGEVVLEPFNRLTRKDAAALEADGADVVRFLA
ncbi:MAG TPA: winged helix DNA-binding domain-containing protein [Thermoleophilaceae bacterium]|nr:winged helix DNA-binding domain-containing protein [Thermoleophilaceae bacterium]